jgi:hypothetical protein
VSCVEKKSLDGARKMHSGRTEQRCKSFLDRPGRLLYQTSMQKKVIRHGHDEHVLQSILVKGRMPLLQITGSGELLKAAVVNENPSAAYTAISHV